ncbi:hypothetical protein [Amycolatopsis methanolica]|uniref:hypothetical protein n=1 Tax=Amycolatopsis methanolica TaxID=1814 RepID=UPI0004783FD0|nr:hypothetical protein [Amycolatopsis methanolica]
MTSTASSRPDGLTASATSSSSTFVTDNRPSQRPDRTGEPSSPMLRCIRVRGVERAGGDGAGLRAAEHAAVDRVQHEPRLAVRFADVGPDELAVAGHRGRSVVRVLVVLIAEVLGS